MHLQVFSANFTSVTPSPTHFLRSTTDSASVSLRTLFTQVVSVCNIKTNWKHHKMSGRWCWKLESVGPLCYHFHARCSHPTPPPHNVTNTKWNFYHTCILKIFNFFFINFFSQSSEVLKGLQRNESANKSNFYKLFSLYIYISVR